MGSSFLMCFFVFSLLFTQSFPTAHIYYGLYGMAMSFFWPPIMGWLSQDIEGARLGKSVSYFNLSWSAGIIVGPLVAGVMSAISPRLPLYTGASLFFVTGTLIVAASFTLPKIRADKEVDLSNDQENTRQDSSTFLRFPGWVGMFTSFVVIGVIINIFPVYARDELFQPKEIIGLLMQSRTFIATFVFIYLGHTTFWHFRISYMISSQIFLACLLLLMRFSSSALILGVLISLVGAVRAHSYTNSVFHGVSGSIKRTGRMAVHESLLAAGLICGSAIGGSLFQYYSMATVYYFCSAVVLFGALVQLALFFILNRVEDHHS
jgi:MFS family permease